MAISVVLAAIIIGAYMFYGSNSGKNYALDPLNATYSIGGQSLALINGAASQEAAPGSSTKITTSIFGEPTMGDLNGDGKTDAAVIIVQNPGGSGTFYFVAAALNAENRTEGTNAILLGDRIAPQTLAVNNGQIIANYADRRAGEPMTAQPSVGVSRYFTVQNGALVELK